MTVTVMSGISGAGKTTYINKHFPLQWKPQFLSGDMMGTVVVSANHYFMTKDDVRTYKFDKNKLAVAHATCFRLFMRAINHGADVIVDNTSTTVGEISPYMLAADAYNIPAEIITIGVRHEDIDACVNQSLHGAPKEAIMRQWRNLKERKLFPNWKKQNILFEPRSITE